MPPLQHDTVTAHEGENLRYHSYNFDRNLRQQQVVVRTPRELLANIKDHAESLRVSYNSRSRTAGIFGQGVTLRRHSAQNLTSNGSHAQRIPRRANTLARVPAPLF